MPRSAAHTQSPVGPCQGQGSEFTRVINPPRGGVHPSPGYKRDVDHDGPPGPAPAYRTARIVVRGEFGTILAAALPDCECATLSGETHVKTQVRDDAELFGVVERLRSLGASVISLSVDP